MDLEQAQGGVCDINKKIAPFFLPEEYRASE